MHIQIDGWHTNVTFSAAHMIARHKKCGRLHGHLYAIHARIYGSPKNDDLLFDFIELKNALRKIASTLDHKVLVPRKSKFIRVRVKKDCVSVESDDKKYLFPIEDVYLLDTSASTTEQIAEHILETFLSSAKLPPHVELVEIGLDESPGQGVWVGRKL